MRNLTDRYNRVEKIREAIIIEYSQPYPADTNKFKYRTFYKFKQAMLRCAKIQVELNRQIRNIKS